MRLRGGSRVLPRSFVTWDQASESMTNKMIDGAQKWEAVPGFDVNSRKYVPLNLDDWLHDHGIIEDGAARGANDQPAADIESLDGTEAKIVDWINQRGRNCRDVVASHLSDVERQLADMDRDEDLDNSRRDVDTQEQNGKRALKIGADQGANDLAPLAVALRDATRDYANFRRANGLARQPEELHRRRSIALICIFFLVEVGLNAGLLTEVNTFGFIGSFGQMTLISLLNVVLLGLVMGALVREFHHVQVWRKGLALSGVLGVVVAAIFFNLLVGHFRDSMQAVANAPVTELSVLGDDAIKRLLAVPLGWEAFQSGLLAALGVAFFGLGAFEWLRWDDRYPGYGPKHRQLQGIQRNYVAAYDRVQAALAKAYTEYEERFKDVVHKLRVKQDRYRELGRLCEAIAENYPTNLEQYQHDLDFLLRAWRTANQDARSTPAPRHFATTVVLDASVRVAPNFSPPEGNSLEHRERLMQRVHEAISSVQSEYEEQLGRFKRLDQFDSQAGPEE